MSVKGKNQRSVRVDNLLQALRILVFQGPCSRKNLADQLGLSKMCITNIINFFIKLGLVVETEPTGGQPVNVGPRPNQLRIASGILVTIGVHITENEVNGILLDISMDVIKECHISMESITSKSQLLDSIKAIIDELTEYAKSKNSYVLSIGITDSHLLNRTRGAITFKGNSMDIDMKYLETKLNERFSIPVYVEDDLLGKLLAEMAYGNYDIRKKHYFIYISDEIRGAYSDGYYIQRGAVGLSGQVGHMSIKWDGPKCYCGNRGCYQNYASINAMLVESNCLTIEELNHSLINREPSALRAQENFVQASAVAFTNIMNLYDPEAIVVMGKVVQLEGAVLKKIEYLVNNSYVYRKFRNLAIIPSKLTEEEYKRGPALLALYRIFEDTNSVSDLCDKYDL